MKIRISGASPAELDHAERLLRIVFEASVASPDYQNRRRHQGEHQVPGARRYLNDVVPRTDLDVWAVVFGNYEPAEVVSLHLSHELAEAAGSAAMHEVTEWTVKLPEIEQHAADGGR